MPTGGCELHVERRGAGETLLLVQGLGANAAHWGEPFLRELERDFEVVTYDHRGIGRSAALTGDVTTAGLAGDALALLDALGIERAHVFGFSMGGMVAQELALAAPQRLRTLTLAATSAGGTQSKATSDDVVRTLTTAILSGDRRRVLEVGYRFVVSRAYAADRGNYAVFEAVAREHPATVKMLMEQQSAVIAHDSYGRLRSLRVPTLVVHGGEDQMLDAVNGDLLASLIPGARLELLEGVGHLLFWERPEHVARLVREHALADVG